jgi:hypothetical protein
MHLFKGATKKIGTSKKKIIKRGNIKCTCGSLEKFFSTLYYLHDKDCIINMEKVK